MKLRFYQVLDEVGSLIEKSRFPFFVAPMGRGFVDETLPNYQGVYAGIASCPSVREDFESSDMILTIGRVPTDINTGGFTCVTDSSRLIEIIPDRVTVWNTVYSAVGMKSLLKRITNRVPTLDKRSCPKPWRQEKEATKDRLGDFRIEHNWIWPRFSDFLRENDIVVVESGTSSFGIWNTRLPKGAIALSQTLWASIGFSLGACQGASLASRDLNGQPQRTILIVGDGSFQLSVQELSTIIRNGLTPTM
jgi:pyruvate decarboxylase